MTHLPTEDETPVPGELLLYTSPDGNIRLDLRIHDETLWMTQQMMAELLAKNPAPDKEKKQMAWVQHMNSLKAQAEELVLTELIYS